MSLFSTIVTLIPGPVAGNNVPTVIVYAPSVGQVWTGGSAHSISWTMMDEDETLLVDIEYLVDGVSTPIATGLLRLIGANTYTWTVPAEDLANAIVRVCAKDSWMAVGCDVSGTFAIDSAEPDVVTTSPTGGNAGLDESITIEFSETMNWTNVEGAISVTPNPGGLGFRVWNRTTIRLDHDPFEAGTSYFVSVSCLATDDSDPGNPLRPCPVTWSLTAATPPAMSFVVPTGGERWTGGTVHTVQWSASDGEDPTEALEVYLEYSLDGTSWWPLAGPLPGDASYPWTVLDVDAETVRLRGRIVDTRGLAATSTSPPFALDVTPPKVTAVDPPNGTAGVGWRNPLLVTFSESMNQGVGLDGLGVLDPEGGWVPGTVSWDSASELRFTPAEPYRASTTYVAHVNATAMDASDPGIPIAAPFQWTFRTQSNEDPTVTMASPPPPVISGGSPWTVEWLATDPEDSPDELQVFLEFSDGGPFAHVAGPLPASGTYTWTAPSRDLANATLRVRVVDSQGWEAADGVTFAIDATPPVIVGSQPAPGDVGVSADASIVITFSEPMNPSSASGVGLWETSTGAWISLATAWDNPETLRLTPVETLREAMEYEVVANGTVRDASAPGNALAETSWTFVVASVPPALVVEEPTPGTRWAAGVPQTVAVWTRDAQDPTVTVAIDIAFDGFTFLPLLDGRRIANGEGSFDVTVPRVDAPNAVLRVCVGDGAGAQTCVDVPLAIDALRPRLLQSVPVHGTRQVHPQASLVLTFSESMDTASVEAAFSLRPSVPLTFRWATTFVDGDTLFVDHARLRELTTYTATLDCTAHDRSVPGLPLWNACPLVWTFTTAASPGVRLLSPVGGERLTGGTDQTVRWVVADEEPAVRATVELSLDGGVSFPVRLVDGEPFPTGAVRTARTLPAVDATAVVRVTVEDSLGLTDSATSGPFAIDGTPPRLASATPRDGARDVSPLEDIVLVFSEPMDPSSLTGSAMTPQPPHVVITWSATSVPFDTVRIAHGPFRLGARVTVSLNGMRDASGPGHPLAGALAFTVAPDQEKPRVSLVVEAEAVRGDVIVLDATASTDNDEIVHYVWTVRDADDRAIARLRGARVEYRALASGEYSVTLIVVDPAGNAAQAGATLRIRDIGSGDPVLPLPTSALGWLALAGGGGAAAYGMTGRGQLFLTRVLLLPLYVKLKGKAVVNQETRGMIRGYIRVHPGDSYTDIKRNLGLANGELAYHLSVLEREGIVRSKTKGAKRVYYPAEAPVPEDGGGLHDVQRRIVRNVEGVPGMSVRDLAGLLGVSSQLALYHLRKLTEDGLVRLERRGVKLRAYPTSVEERMQHRRT